MNWFLFFHACVLVLALYLSFNVYTNSHMVSRNNSVEHHTPAWPEWGCGICWAIFFYMAYC